MDLSSDIYRSVCMHCFLKSSHCICKYIKKIDNKITVIILQHYKERNKAIGTEKIVRLSLSKTKTYSGIDFNQHPDLDKIRENSDNSLFLLYPNKKAQYASTSSINTHSNKYLFVIDGTWTQAKQILKINPWLLNLSTIQLDLPTISQYKIRTQPYAMCLSTVEATTYCLEQMEQKPDKYKSLISTFTKMVDRQCLYIPKEHLEKRPKFRKQKKGP